MGRCVTESDLIPEKNSFDLCKISRYVLTEKTSACQHLLNKMIFFVEFAESL